MIFPNFLCSFLKVLKVIERVNVDRKDTGPE